MLLDIILCVCSFHTLMSAHPKTCMQKPAMWWLFGCYKAPSSILGGHFNSTPIETIWTRWTRCKNQLIKRQPAVKRAVSEADRDLPTSPSYQASLDRGEDALLWFAWWAGCGNSTTRQVCFGYLLQCSRVIKSKSHTPYLILNHGTADASGVTGAWEVRKPFQGVLHFDCAIQLG